jgi:hypothetical protein
VRASCKKLDVSLMIVEWASDEVCECHTIHHIGAFRMGLHAWGSTGRRYIKFDWLVPSTYDALQDLLALGRHTVNLLLNRNTVRRKLRLVVCARNHSCDDPLEHAVIAVISYDLLIHELHFRGRSTNRSLNLDRLRHGFTVYLVPALDATTVQLGPNDGAFNPPGGLDGTKLKNGSYGIRIGSPV